jgi:hypothetical protein
MWPYWAVVASFSIDSWYLYSPAEYLNSRMIDMELIEVGQSGYEVVATGNAYNFVEHEQDRSLLTVKFFLDDDHDTPVELWRFIYKAGPLDDDSYAVTACDLVSSEEGWISFGYHQADIGPGYQWSPWERLLSAGVPDEDDYTTPVLSDFVLLTGGRDEGDRLYKEAEYTGSGRWTACGLFAPDHLNPDNYDGFLQFGLRGQSLGFFPEEEVASWERIVVDGEMGVTVLGGFSDDFSALYLAIYDGDYQLGSFGQSGYSVLEGPLVLLREGLYFYAGRVTHIRTGASGMASTMWSWDGSSLVLEDSEIFTNAQNPLSSYEDISPIDAALTGQGDLLVAFNAINSSSQEGILLARVELDLTSSPPEIGSLYVLGFVECSLGGLTPDARHFCFIDPDPGEIHLLGVGHQHAGWPMDRIWFFEISEDS